SWEAILQQCPTRCQRKARLRSGKKGTHRGTEHTEKREEGTGRTAVDREPRPTLPLLRASVRSPEFARGHSRRGEPEKSLTEAQSTRKSRRTQARPTATRPARSRRSCRTSR